MKPSDARVRQKKDQLQQARNARGKSWQDDLLAVRERMKERKGLKA